MTLPKLTETDLIEGGWVQCGTEWVSPRTGNILTTEDATFCEALHRNSENYVTQTLKELQLP